MKRTALLRRTPLRRGTSQLVTRKPLLRGGPLNPVSAKRRGDNAVRTRVVSAMRLQSQGRCARCGRADVAVHGHERLGRAQGGDILNPDCLLCVECNGWCEDNPQVAAFTGWKISAKWTVSHDLQIWQAFDLAGNIVDFTVPAEAAS